MNILFRYVKIIDGVLVLLLSVLYWSLCIRLGFKKDSVWCSKKSFTVLGALSVVGASMYKKPTENNFFIQTLSFFVMYMLFELFWTLLIHYVKGFKDVVIKAKETPNQNIRNEVVVILKGSFIFSLIASLLFLEEPWWTHTFFYGSILLSVYLICVGSLPEKR